MDEFMDKVKKCLGLKAHYHVQGFYFNSFFFFLANHSKKKKKEKLRIREKVARQKKPKQTLADTFQAAPRLTLESHEVKE